jgi:hypothetical protein
MFALDPLFASPDNSFGGPGLGLAILIGAILLLVSVVLWFTNLFLLVSWEPLPGQRKTGHVIALAVSALDLLAPRFLRYEEMAFFSFVLFPVFVITQFFRLRSVRKGPR